MTARRPLFPLPFMQRAIYLAEQAASIGEVPVGAVVVCDGAIVGEGHNHTRGDGAKKTPDPTGHAEIVALRQAAATLTQERLTDCELWVTLEPCAMCAGAIAHARIDKLYYAASDPKGGAVEHGARIFDQAQCLHRPEIYTGFYETEAAELLRNFFRARR
ncbi:MAG: nucleoside deaminase [Pontixanthobacter sp.]